MARSRSIPTKLYWDPAFSDLDGETQSVFLGLTLEADDYGRGLCHAGNLSRALNKEVSVITQALDRLEEAGLIIRYQVENQTYYHHRKWDEWERLDKRTPSQYPPPPEEKSFPGEILGNPGEPGPEEEEKRREVELKRREVEERPANVIPLPTSGGGGEDMKRVESITREVATILKLPADAALRRVVADFLDAKLSLLGEADAAREYIDSPRNRRGKTMTATFYRQWLKREQDSPRQEAPADTPSRGPEAKPAARATGKAGKSLMGLTDQYRKEVSS